MIKITGHQPHYLPSVEYFARLNFVDRFVISDVFPYNPKDWQNRNRVLNQDGKPVMLTLPVARKIGTKIHEKIVSDPTVMFKHARHFRLMYPDSIEIGELCNFLVWLSAKDDLHLVDVTVTLTLLLADLLGLDDKKFVVASDILGFEYQDASELIARQVDALNGQVYVSGPSWKDYLNLDVFKQRNLGVQEFHWEDTHNTGNVSVVDLIGRYGYAAKDYLGRITVKDVP